jgi:hypothetical protein
MSVRLSDRHVESDPIVPVLLSVSCLLTVLKEAPFLALCGYRGMSAIAIIVCTNLITNLLMNVLLTLLCSRWTIGALVLAEVLVVVAEYLIYSVTFGGGRKLFCLRWRQMLCRVGWVDTDENTATER